MSVLIAQELSIQQRNAMASVASIVAANSVLGNVLTMIEKFHVALMLLRGYAATQIRQTSGYHAILRDGHRGIVRILTQRVCGNCIWS
ncbi:MAG: hypothetical protein WBI44_05935 [Syntrophaceticus sp.]